MDILCGKDTNCQNRESLLINTTSVMRVEQLISNKNKSPKHISHRSKPQCTNKSLVIEDFTLRETKRPLGVVSGNCYSRLEGGGIKERSLNCGMWDMPG
ncbi:hypothetical protein TNCV_670411 [Trichonephila clavipes]|nr:hypothetical protein TNCV_670411 [Trichonephila clavipes]